jgi:hypothetical protein
MDLPHQPKPAPWRLGLVARKLVSRAYLQAKPAVDALGRIEGGKALFLFLQWDRFLRVH